MIKFISKELKLFTQFELSEIAIEFLARNLRRHRYTGTEKENLANHFKRHLMKRESQNQTS